MTLKNILAGTALVLTLGAPAAFAEAHAMKFDETMALSGADDQSAAMTGANGGTVSLMDGQMLGTITDASIDGNGKAMFNIDVGETEVQGLDKPMMMLTVPADKVSVNGNAVAINVNQQDLVTSMESEGTSGDIEKIDIQ